jgi:LytS/YehU family sensor histidine kinase
MREKVETELRFLKVQLNPHFLFNTLNNLYYLTTEKSEKAPQAILQLSEMLDYVMHSSKSMFVPLEKELKQVENYIALELLRYEDRVKIKTRFSDNLSAHTIGPMILITLIENAFKHGVMPLAGNAWINLEVEASENNLLISISNSSKNNNAGEGIGLENLKNQLDHLYKENYSMKVDRTKVNEFSVTLILNQNK